MLQDIAQVLTAASLVTLAVLALLGKLTGPRGEKGERGEVGQAGRDGLPGRDGRDGADGQDGKDGAPGADGLPGRDGMVIYQDEHITGRRTRFFEMYKDNKPTGHFCSEGDSDYRQALSTPGLSLLNHKTGEMVQSG